MTQKDFIKAVAKDAKVTQDVASTVITSSTNVIKDALVKGDSVQISGFGAFVVKENAARDGKNPLTGEKIHIEAKKVPKFKAAKAFKEIMNAK